MADRDMRTAVGQLSALSSPTALSGARPAAHATIDRVWLMPVVELRSHALAYGLTGPMELTAMVAAVAAEIDVDEARAGVPR